MGEIIDGCAHLQVFKHRHARKNPPTFGRLCDGKAGNLGKDLAIGVGTGVRIDFTYFMIRLDFSYKVKDPVRMGNGGWMDFKNFAWTDIRPNGLQVSNYALQLGIGLPF